MLFRLKSYLQFILHSTNQHDVHSPFVYDFVTKCLYSTPKKSNNKTLDVLLKSIHYCNAQTIEIIGDTTYKTLIVEKYPGIVFNVFPMDLIFIENLTSESSSSILSEKKVRNNSMILLGNIHKNAKTSNIWKMLTKNEFFNVSIDMFYCGVLFRRTEQEKEHFTIRI